LRNLSKDFAGLSNENKLLLYCSRVGVSEEYHSELNDLLSSPLDWNFILEAARSRNIPQLLYHNLKGLSNWSLIPSRVMQDFKKAYHETVARNMHFYAELQTILNAFYGAGVRPIALKGAALAGVVYPDIGLRPMVDIDLLVKEDELAFADKVMTDLGYSTVHSWKSERGYKEHHFHLPPYRHARKPIVVEIHWDITRRTFGTDIHKWWPRAINENIMGHAVLVPSPVDMLIHLCLHLFNHGYENGLVLRCLCDIFETLRHYGQEIDWKFLQDETTQQGIEKQVHSILQLAMKFYAYRGEALVPMKLAHADNDFLQVLERNLFVFNGGTTINPHLMKSMMFNSFSERMKYLLSKIFPRRQDMSVRYPASTFPMMVFFYYLVRPFQLLARYGGGAVKMFRPEKDGKE
jgi:hypothetical protein